MKDTHQRSWFKSKKAIVIYILLALLIALRIALPYIVLNYVNKQLSSMKEYRGHVNDINIALIRGAYVIRDIRIDKIDPQNGNKVDSIPFFVSPTIDLS